MPDGRKLLVDRRAIAFLCECRAEDFGGKEAVVIAFRTQCKPCPVRASYGDLGHGGSGPRLATARAPELP